jgi:hypothetical protein
MRLVIKILTKRKITIVEVKILANCDYYTANFTSRQVEAGIWPARTALEKKSAEVVSALFCLHSFVSYANSA